MEKGREYPTKHFNILPFRDIWVFPNVYFDEVITNIVIGLLIHMYNSF